MFPSFWASFPRPLLSLEKLVPCRNLLGRRQARTIREARFGPHNRCQKQPQKNYFWWRISPSFRGACLLAVRQLLVRPSDRQRQAIGADQHGRNLRVLGSVTIEGSCPPSCRWPWGSTAASLPSQQEPATYKPHVRCFRDGLRGPPGTAPSVHHWQPKDVLPPAGLRRALQRIADVGVPDARGDLLDHLGPHGDNDSGGRGGVPTCSA